MKFLSNIKNIVSLDGRNKKLTDNPHVFERVSEFTNILCIDDAHKYFDFFYSLITDGMTINAKHTKSKELDFSKSPKMVVTSNFPPPKNDPSTLRRLLIMVFSDYYHKATDDNDYLEDRYISHDFGYDLHNILYREEWWNEDFNFLIDCLQFYLSTIPKNIIVQAPMENVIKRINIATMGQAFKDWADVYFSEAGNYLDRLLIKECVMNDFMKASNKTKITTQYFTKALKAFAKNADFIDCMNPPELCGKGDNKKRIMKRVDGEVREMIYMKSIWTDELNPDFE
ncbi:hypothetical protein LJC11_03280 [Bacteroidales bacterium OttesenSCG-928-I21]|nr:hypothetical protein [Bacteroidales bacterium OttesenSCG-928-I21]